MLPKNIRKYFWDIDVKKEDWRSNPDFIIARVLEYGDFETIRWLIKTFGEKKIKEVVPGHRGFSPKSANLWASFFNIDKNKMVCLKSPYKKMQKTHWPY